jgi:hypothetical protein
MRTGSTEKEIREWKWPALSQQLPLLRSGYLVADESSEVVAGVVVRVAVVSFEVGAVLGERTAVLRDFVEVMSPGVDGLSREVVPVAHAELRLKRVVVGGSDAFDLVDVAVLGVLRIVPSEYGRSLLSELAPVACGSAA